VLNLHTTSHDNRLTVQVFCEEHINNTQIISSAKSFSSHVYNAIGNDSVLMSANFLPPNTNPRTITPKFVTTDQAVCQLNRQMDKNSLQGQRRDRAFLQMVPIMEHR
jgi:hypothetical protein